MEQDTTDAILRIAARAADVWALDSYQRPISKADRTRGVVEVAVMHLIEQGLLVVPDDIDERLSRPIPFARQDRPVDLTGYVTEVRLKAEGAPGE